MARFARFKITHGPSKYDLMRSLMDPRYPDGPKYVTFSLQAEGSDTVRPIPMSVEMLGPEDGSGDGWIITLRDSASQKPSFFKGHYRSDSRGGSIQSMEAVREPNHTEVSR